MEEAPKLSVTLSLKMKVNTPEKYESAEAFLSVSGITAETTEFDIAELLDGPGKVAYGMLKQRLGEKVRELRSGVA